MPDVDDVWAIAGSAPHATVTASNQARVFGAANPTFTVTYAPNIAVITLT